MDADGLRELFNEDQLFQCLVRNIWALAYVPEDDVIRAWSTFIKEKLVEGLKTWGEEWETMIIVYIKYIDVNWIGELNHRTQVRKRPAYPIAMWNKHVATKQGEHKTNNLCEGYNRAFSISVPDNATVWAIVDLFKAEEATAKQSIIRAARGEVSPEAGKSRSLARIATEEQLLALVNNYHNISLSMFMESMVYFFDK